jgi:DNA-binding transcriptional MerR regulator
MVTTNRIIVGGPLEKNKLKTHEEIKKLLKPLNPFVKEGRMNIKLIVAVMDLLLRLRGSSEAEPDPETHEKLAEVSKELEDWKDGIEAKLNELDEKDKELKSQYLKLNAECVYLRKLIRDLSEQDK